ncbi:DNA-binding transcriptional regulator YiaG [Paraburkholderia sp. GAS33]|uniref:helix-turn-helix domain-containing protein n=1 Tax=Paraburkholderia sp. GAS33 TaxID=3035130 RepID=UPI003D1BA7AA
MGTSEPIRPQCLRPAGADWQKSDRKPTGVEIREVIRRAGLTGGQAAALLGISGDSGGRTVRRWISGESDIPYSAWAILCHVAGLGIIWVDNES